MSTPSTPHDGFFKKCMADITLARDFLRHHLPAAICAQCDLTSLKLEPCAFVEPDLQKYFSDVLYSMRTKDDQAAFVHVLVEHQSSPDRLLAFRMLRYSIAIMQQHLEQQSGPASAKRLPLVVPLAFYHGEKSPYPYSMDWLDSFANRELAQRIFSSPFQLVDITVIPEEAIMTHHHVAAMELIFKHALQRDFLAIVPQLARLIFAPDISSELRKTFVYYATVIGNSENGEQFINALLTEAPRHSEEIMTIAEQLIEKGRQEGIQRGMLAGRQEGRQEGIQQGEQTAKLDMARQLLLNNVDRQMIKSVTGLSDDELDALAE